ncbi:MAG: hypothetical protein RR357_01420 [Clostridia bacterium]
MGKFTLKHKIVLLATASLWAIWIVFIIYFRDLIIGNIRMGTQFGVLFALTAIVYGMFFLPIIHPDMNFIPKKVHDNNRELVFTSRRTAYCFLQLIYVFFLGGTSISLYFDTWRIGIGVVVALFVICFLIVLVVYGLEIKKYFAIPAPDFGKVIVAEDEIIDQPEHDTDASNGDDLTEGKHN